MTATRIPVAASFALSRRRFRTGAIALMVLCLAACGGDIGIEPPTTIGPPTSAVAEQPEPRFAWPLDGDGEASIGDVALDLSGSRNLGSDAIAFDGVTGSATSTAQGLIDTTKSFSVAAWVSLDHEVEHAIAVSQIGEVAAAFYLGYTGFEWSFNMKRADGPGGNAYAKKANAEHDLTAWVHLVGVYDQSAQRIRLYRDGELVAETAFRAEWQASGPLTVRPQPGRRCPGQLLAGCDRRCTDLRRRLG